MASITVKQRVAALAVTSATFLMTSALLLQYSITLASSFVENRQNENPQEQHLP